MATTKTPCTGNCMNCAPFQRQYCSAQMTYNTMGLVNTMAGKFDALLADVELLKSKIEAIQNTEAEVFNPMEESQDGDGEKE